MLPTEILWKIFSDVPDLLSARSVCLNWCETIDTPEFGSFYFKKNRLEIHRESEFLTREKILKVWDQISEKYPGFPGQLHKMERWLGRISVFRFYRVANKSKTIDEMNTDILSLDTIAKFDAFLVFVSQYYIPHDIVFHGLLVGWDLPLELRDQVQRCVGRLFIHYKSYAQSFHKDPNCSKQIVRAFCLRWLSLLNYNAPLLYCFLSVEDFRENPITWRFINWKLFKNQYQISNLQELIKK
jgi:hypothetical protein